MTFFSRRQFAAIAGAAAGATGLGACATVPTQPSRGGKRPWPYLLGADITWVPEDEAIGATYWQDGVQRDPLAIFADAGFNAIKLRTFVNPQNGYSQGKPAGLDASPCCSTPSAAWRIAGRASIGIQIRSPSSWRRAGASSWLEQERRWWGPAL